MGLIDVFMRSNQARKVLFVADRDELVRQAKTDGFEAYLPHEPCTRIRSWDIDTTQRLYAVTLQTLSNIFEQFSPAFFDLIVFDEVHRSIFNKFITICHKQYFARLVGAHEHIDQAHCSASLACPRCHDNERIAFALRKGFSHTPNRFVLVGTVNDFIVDLNGTQRLPILANVAGSPDTDRVKKPKTSRLAEIPTSTK